MATSNWKQHQVVTTWCRAILAHLHLDEPVTCSWMAKGERRAAILSDKA